MNKNLSSHSSHKSKDKSDQSPEVGSESRQEPRGGAGDERELVARLRQGDDDAYEQFVRAHSDALLAVARRFLRSEDDARDALQDAFLAAFKALPNFEGGSKLSTWLHRIVVNACLMKLRSSRRRRESSIESLLPTFLPDGHRAEVGPGWAATADELLSDGETRVMVRAKLDELPDDFRTVLWLRDIEELDTAATAAALEISEAAVKTRLHRARQALRTLLEREFSR